MPKNSLTGPVTGGVSARLRLRSSGMWWLAIVGILAIIVTVIARSFASR